MFIQAGAGGVGSVAIPMAKHLGAKVYTTTSAKNRDYVKSLGADVVIDYTSGDYESVLRQHEPAGVDLVLEALLGNGTAEAAIRLTKDGGRVAYMNNEPPEMDEIEQRAITAEFLHHRPDGEMLKELVDLYQSRYSSCQDSGAPSGGSNRRASGIGTRAPRARWYCAYLIQDPA